MDKKEIILNAASEVFRRYGIDKTKMSDIGKESGFKTSSLYYYFTTKDDLVQQMLVHDLERIKSALTASLKGESDLKEGLKKYLITRTEETDIIKRYREFFQNSAVPPDLRSLMKQLERDTRSFEHRLLKDFVINRGAEYVDSVDVIVSFVLAISMKLTVYRTVDNDDMRTITRKVDRLLSFLLREN